MCDTNKKPKPLYNRELKESFMKSYAKSKSTKNTCEQTFAVTEKYEREWGKDLCAQSEDIIRPVIENIVGLRKRSKSVVLSMLREYARYCIRENVPDACDALINLKVTGFEKTRRQTVSSPEHLEKYLNELLDPVQDKTIDNIYRCYYWLAYAGMAEEDILKVKTGDVDLTSMVVRYNGEEYPIYRDAVPAFKNCVELTRFVYKHPNYPPKKAFYKDRIPGDILIRGIRSAPSARVIRVELSRKSKRKQESGETEQQLSHFRVWISGLFYRVNVEEQMGIEPNFKDIVYKQTRHKVYKLDSGRNTQSDKLRQMARDYLEDYRCWKLVYKK